MISVRKVIRGQAARASRAACAGLAGDAAGQYRETLLQKQQQILGAISARALGERERLARGIPIPS